MFNLVAYQKYILKIADWYSTERNITVFKLIIANSIFWGLDVNYFFTNLLFLNCNILLQ